VGIRYNSPLTDILDKLTSELGILDIENEIAILVRKNEQAKIIVSELNENGHNFVYIPRTPLDRGTKNAGILIELAKYAKNPRYSVYDFINELVGEYSPKEIKEINNIIKVFKEERINEEQVTSALIELFNKLGLSMDIKELKSFCKVVLGTEYDIAFNGSEYKHKVMTVHSAKGLEFDQVIIFASDYRVFQGDGLNEHYVATTRGKDKLIIILDDEKYIYHLLDIKSKCNVKSIEKLIRII
ncbi:ATP-binding domain-containing protein, partial [Aeribacillus pallidus]|nr:ATP-binding domain-containing protein [Aeribacillus pallidus]